MTRPAELEYPCRLLAAAELVLSSDRGAEGSPPLNASELQVSGALKPHQLDGVSWLLRRYELGVNVVLGDEMGLGKTLQAISLMSYLKAHFMTPGPFLVMCPLSVTEGWMLDFAKFCPNLGVLKYVGDKGCRLGLRRMIHDHLHKKSSSSDMPLQGQLKLPFDVLLTTYDIALLDQDFLSQIPWQYAVIDEAQRLKNPSSVGIPNQSINQRRLVLYNVLEHRYVMPRRLLMTGTPIQNNLSELWSLMHFCMPAVFGTLEQFISTFKDVGREQDVVKKQFQTLKYVLKAFMLRRTKAMLSKSGTLMLPRLTEITVMVPLVPLQKKVYMSILRRELPTILALSSGSYSHQSLQNIVVQLRKACSHPYLFNGIEPEPYEEGEHLVQASGKLIVLDQLLRKLHEAGHRILLFAQMTHTLDILQDFLELRKYTYERLDGSVRAEERFAAIRSFSSRSADGSVKTQAGQDGAYVFMISTRAGGVGLNLVAADTVIFYEQDWNPQVDKQALQRAHRIGQMNPVLSINLVTQHTIEEAIMRRADKKLNLCNNVVGQEDDVSEVGKSEGHEVGVMRSLICGLDTFDLICPSDEKLSDKVMEELNAMTDKVVGVRSNETSDKDDQKFEINLTSSLSDNLLLERTSGLSSFDPEFDEASYQSWVEKLQEASKSNDSSTLDVRKRRNVLEEAHAERKAEKTMTEEKRLAKWEALGYQSLALKDPDLVVDSNIMSDPGSVQFVYGDCTRPSKICPSVPAIIFSCVDTSGNWGHGGMFDALADLSVDIPDAYHRAFECGDLHLGDVHLVKLQGSDGEDIALDAPHWVALAVVQSYNPRRKVPRSKISMADLERCLSKASFSAAQSSAFIHMPRIGYQDGSQRAEWYTVERLLRKYASLYGIKIFVHYFRRPSH